MIPYDNPQHIDNAREEYEGYGSKILSIYDGAQKKTSDVFNVNFRLCKIFSSVIVNWGFFCSQPQPVHNNLKESEKYGNTGDQLKGVENVAVGALSVVSNLLNAVIAVSLKGSKKFEISEI